MPRFLSLCGAFIIYTSSAASITQISSLQQLLHEVNAQTFVVLDIDNTILEPLQMRATDQWFCAMFKHVCGLGYDYLEAVAKILPFYFEAHSHTKVKLVEQCGCEVINELCRKSLAVIALTARSLPMIVHTKRQFKSLGIDLTRSGVGRTQIKFTLKMGPVEFVEGVTYCGNNDKGETLLSVLDRLSLAPRTILFVDDKEKNLTSVARAAARRKISFIGKRFSGCDAKVASFVLDEKSKQLIQPKGKVLQNLTPTLSAG